MSEYLQIEHEFHRDTLLGDTVPAEDSYYNLHAKSRLFMQWTLQKDSWHDFGHTLRYVVMIDDDVYLRLPYLLRVLMAGPGVRDYQGEVRSLLECFVVMMIIYVLDNDITIVCIVLFQTLFIYPT
jgi:hypothetical protein